MDSSLTDRRHAGLAANPVTCGVGDLLISACESNGLKTDSESVADATSRRIFFVVPRSAPAESAGVSRHQRLHAVMPLNHNANGCAIARGFTTPKPAGRNAFAS
jgi:hypothetical protein